MPIRERSNARPAHHLAPAHFDRAATGGTYKYGLATGVGAFQQEVKPFEATVFAFLGSP